MAGRLFYLKELFYGAALYTIITAVPDIVIKLHLSGQLGSSLSIRYPGVGFYMIGSLLFTGMVLFSRRFRCHFLFLLAWSFLMCIKFLLNVKLQVRAIHEMSPYGRPTGLFMALIVYCIAFSMALELMLNWMATCQLMPTHIVVNIQVFRGLEP